MKKTVFIAVILLSTLTIFAQENMPSYPEVLHQFFYTYSVEENPVDSYLNFAKRKDGWYAQKIDQLNKNVVLSEAPFWTLKDKLFENLDTMFEVGYDESKAEENISLYLSGSPIYQWKEYERCRYAGYIGWDQDMIDDFGNVQNLSDTLLEGLARAYANKGGSYLWFSIDRRPDPNDTLQRSLGSLEIPSEKRMSKFQQLTAKAVETFDRLLKQNPNYNTQIGNIYLKTFNESFHAWSMAMLAMQDKKANELLSKITLAEPYIAQAKNYLNSCDKNAILFTYGDNDTYQLWYVQEKENFRKDVTVINTSFLDLPVYVDMLKKRKQVNFSMPFLYYSAPGATLCYYREPKEKSKSNETDLGIFLKNIYSRKISKENNSIPGLTQINSIYETKKLKLSIDNTAFNKLSVIKTNPTSSKISFELRSDNSLSDLAIFDIINENINTRPVYFTYSFPNYFENNLVQQGIVFRLFPMKNENKAIIAKKEIKALEKFADSIYKPITVFDVNGYKNISDDGINAIFVLYTKIADQYRDPGDSAKAKKWLKKTEALIPVISNDYMDMASFLIDSYLRLDKQKVKQYAEMYAQYIYAKYRNLNSANGYLSKDNCLKKLKGLKDLFKEQGIESDIVDALLKQLD